MTLHIALWSVPGQGAAALHRAFGARSDAHVTDQPLYGHYLARTGVDHPGRDDLLARLPTDWRRTTARLTGPAPGGAPVWVQKHMAHHLTMEVDRGWLAGMRHLFLIEQPRAQVPWLTERLGTVRFEDTGLPHQLELFRWLRRTTGAAPAVFTTESLLASPMGTLAAACEAVGLRFERSMLSWGPGVLPCDGPWAPEWYDLEACGFPPLGATARRPEELPPGLEALVERCSPLHAELESHRLDLALS